MIFAATTTLWALTLIADVKPGSPEMAKAIMQYSDCTIRSVSEFDDGKADPASIATKVAVRCESAYRVWREAVQGYFYKPGDKIPTNLELSLRAVTVGRSGGVKSN
jgi:hypothetical protein